MDDILSLGDLSLSQERKPPVSGGVLMSSNSSRVVILRLMLLFNFYSTCHFCLQLRSKLGTCHGMCTFALPTHASSSDNCLSYYHPKIKKKQKRGLGDFEVLQFTKMVASQRHNGNLDFSNFNFIPLQKEMGTYFPSFCFCFITQIACSADSDNLVFNIFNYYVVSLLQTLSFGQQGFD